MKVKFLKDYLGHKKEAIIDLPEDQAKTAVDAAVAEAVAADIKDLDEAVAGIQKSMTEQLEAAAQKITTRVIDQVSRGLKGVRPTLVIGPDREDLDPTGGFKNLGDFAQSVRKHFTNKASDERIKRMIAKADGMDENILADGGALVPTEYANQLYRDVLAESVLFDKARKYPINIGNSLFIPVRQISTLGQTSAAGASLGTWLNSDGVVINAQKPVYGRVQMTLNRWGTLLPVTDELLQDNNVALSNFIFDEGGIALAWDLNQALINGSGSAQPQGILESGALVTAPADVNQPGFTISYSNLVNMKSHLWTIRPGDTSGVVWIAHPDAEAQFEQLKDAAGRNLYFAAGTIQQSPEARLFGIPVVYSFHCSAIGTPGDVILADLNQYLVSTKVGGGIEAAMSMHLYFDAAEVAYRIIYRVDGKTARQAPLIIPNSANNRSGFVALAARITVVS
ncbi:MAG: phage major capsid protein [Phycisphaerae bacterium]